MTAPREDAWLYPRRLLLRVRGPLLSRRLDRAALEDGLSGLLRQEVVLPADGVVEHAHVGAADWRALLTTTTARGAVREVRLEVGAPWSEPRPGKGFPAEVRALLAPLLDLAAAVGARVVVLDAVPPEADLPRPRGRLERERLDEVLGALGL